MKLIILILVLVLGLVGSSFANDLVAEADEFYELRGEGYDEKTLLASTTHWPRS